MDFIKEIEKKILSKLVDSTRLCDRECNGWENSSHYFSNGGLTITFSVGPVDRGPRTDHGGGEDGDEWLDDNKIEELSEEYYKKSKNKLDNLKDIIEESLAGFEIEMLDSSIDYGEKGHVMLELSVVVKGKWFSWNGEKIWADLSGAYSKDSIMLMTPDIERYFDTEEEIVKFLSTFNYKNDSPF